MVYVSDDVDVRVTQTDELFRELATTYFIAGKRQSVPMDALKSTYIPLFLQSKPAWDILPSHHGLKSVVGGVVHTLQQSIIPLERIKYAQDPFGTLAYVGIFHETRTAVSYLMGFRPEDIPTLYVRAVPVDTAQESNVLAHRALRKVFLHAYNASCRLPGTSPLLRMDGVELE